VTTTTCFQCGAILLSGVRACHFCDSILDHSAQEHETALHSCPAAGSVNTDTSPGEAQDLPWLGELEQRLDAYRARHGGSSRGSRYASPPPATAGIRAKAAPQTLQSQLPFGEPEAARYASAVTVAEPTEETEPSNNEFSFTIAIGRYSPPPEKRDGRLEIDVSIPPGEQPGCEPDDANGRTQHYGLYPVASLEQRRWAALIDIVCLLFAYGGFLALFGSLGGQFTLSKLSAEVYAATFAIVYLQYFALFTVFGGTTPGMMFRGLQVSSFTGEVPTPRQMLLRSLGYMISASTVFLGFFWAWWDEDALSWHDRISRTYLTSPETRGNMHSATPAPTR
jgi:uncharacterized RDD family membrane protein YckC